MRSSRELEQELAEVRKAEEEAAKVAEIQRRDEERRHSELAKAATDEAAQVERMVDDAVAQVSRTPAPGMTRRVVCRAYLRGEQLPVAELQDRESFVTTGDPGATALLAAKQSASRALVRLTDPLGDVVLSADDEAIRRLDAAEVRAHRAWLDRIKEAAGED